MTAHRSEKPLQGEPIFATLAEFEDGILDIGSFDHTAHLYIAWTLLEECPVLEAMQRFTCALRQIVRIHGIKGKYHETLSCFLIVLIAERKSRGAYQDFDEFANANSDLLTGSKALLHEYYSPLRLASPLAKRQFLLPDRVTAS